MVSETREYHLLTIKQRPPISTITPIRGMKAVYKVQEKVFLGRFPLKKLVGSRFEQMESKIQGWQISSGNRVYHLHKSVPLWCRKMAPNAWNWYRSLLVNEKRHKFHWNYSKFELTTRVLAVQSVKIKQQQQQLWMRDNPYNCGDRNRLDTLESRST